MTRLKISQANIFYKKIENQYNIVMRIFYEKYKDYFQNHSEEFKSFCFNEEQKQIRLLIAKKFIENIYEKKMGCSPQYIKAIIVKDNLIHITLLDDKEWQQEKKNSTIILDQNTSQINESLLYNSLLNELPLLSTNRVFSLIDMKETSEIMLKFLKINKTENIKDLLTTLQDISLDNINYRYEQNIICKYLNYEMPTVFKPNISTSLSNNLNMMNIYPVSENLKYIKYKMNEINLFTEKDFMEVTKKIIANNLSILGNNQPKLNNNQLFHFELDYAEAKKIESEIFFEFFKEALPSLIKLENSFKTEDLIKIFNKFVISINAEYIYKEVKDNIVNLYSIIRNRNDFNDNEHTNFVNKTIESIKSYEKLSNKEEINILKDIESSYYKDKINDNTWKKMCNSKNCFTLNIEIPTLIMENKFNLLIDLLNDNVGFEIKKDKSNYLFSWTSETPIVLSKENVLDKLVSFNDTINDVIDEMKKTNSREYDLVALIDNVKNSFVRDLKLNNDFLIMEEKEIVNKRPKI